MKLATFNEGLLRLYTFHNLRSEDVNKGLLRLYRFGAVTKVSPSKKCTQSERPLSTGCWVSLAEYDRLLETRVESSPTIGVLVDQDTIVLFRQTIRMVVSKPIVCNGLQSCTCIQSYVKSECIESRCNVTSRRLNATK